MMTSPDLYKTFDAEESITNLEPGMSLAGRYTLIKQIGRGGMGVIWSAEERAAGRKVVLKFVPREIKNFESAVAQIKESFQKIHGLQHQHICPVYTLEEEVSFGYYIVMKWLDGETLDEYIVRTAGRQQSLPFDEVLRILRPVAEALDYAHGKRIIHRDIKPSNIFIELNEAKTIRDVQVIDFGLASEIRSSLSRVSQIRFDTSGTRPYMAPEQWRGRLQSATTDQYSLAVTAYEMLAGYLPFAGDDAEMLRMAIIQDPPEPIREISEQVNAALLRALVKDGSERFESCAQFVAALGGAEILVTKHVSSVPSPKQSSPDRTEENIFDERNASAVPPKTSSGFSKDLSINNICNEPGMKVVLHRNPRLDPDAKSLEEQERLAGTRKVWTILGMAYPFRWCPPGTFTMGSPVGQTIVEKGILWDTKKVVDRELDRDDGEIPHQVTLTKGFWMLETQVTQEMWKRVMGNNPSYFKGNKRLPVEQVSWDDCQAFITKLNDALKRSGDRICLPTEAQWEYACRAGTTTAYYFGDDWRQLEHYAWYSGYKDYVDLKEVKWGDTPHSVGTKKPNAWGLYDMLGNVYEWCSDWYGAYPSGAVTDPVGPSLGTGCVLRGGSWAAPAVEYRSASRCFQGEPQPSERSMEFGLRLALVNESE